MYQQRINSVLLLLSLPFTAEGAIAARGFNILMAVVARGIGFVQLKR